MTREHIPVFVPLPRLEQRRVRSSVSLKLLGRQALRRRPEAAAARTRQQGQEVNSRSISFLRSSTNGLLHLDHVLSPRL